MTVDTDEADIARRVWRAVTGAPRAGGIRDRTNRPVRNGRWYLLGAGVAAQVGWGDLTLGELRAVADGLPIEWRFVVLPERTVVPVSRNWMTAGNEIRTSCPYKSSHHTELRVAALADEATFVAAQGAVRFVDRTRRANRAGNIWFSPGYRLARTGRVIRSARTRLAAVTPAELQEELLALVGSDRRLVDAPPSRQ